MATTDDVVSVQQQGVQYLGLIYKALLEGGVNLVPVPASSASNGTAGQVAADSGFMYLCVATNTWRRWALSTF